MKAPWKKSISRVVFLFTALALSAGITAAADAPATQRNAALPRIVVLATGGTIAGQTDARSEIGYNSAQLSPKQLILAARGIDTIAQISTEQIASIGSQDMTETVWFALANRIRALFERNEADGVVITHGTDTMEETAFFLDRMLAPGKPVVLVGAMRPATANSADGPANLYAAVEVAASQSARGRGALVVLNGTIHGARDVQKTHTTALETFHSPNYGPIGYVDPSSVRFGVPANTPSSARPYSLKLTAPLPRVDIIYAHAQMDSAMIEDAVKRGARGIVLAGVGDGNCSKAAIEALQRASAQGLVVVRASRVGSGYVNRNVEIDDDKLGFVAALDLNPQKARILAQLLIASGVTAPAAVQRAFGEI
jgi:L-asparaginase